MTVKFGDQPMWNPYPFLGLNGSWPRGFPWEHLPGQLVKSATVNHQCLPIVQQLVVTSQLDKDAAELFLLNEDMAKSRKASIDMRPKSLVNPRNVFAPYNSRVSFGFLMYTNHRLQM